MHTSPFPNTLSYADVNRAPAVTVPERFRHDFQNWAVYRLRRRSRFWMMTPSFEHDATLDMKTALHHYVALLLFLLPISAHGFEFTTSLPAPKGATPTIDGRVAEAEWDDAVRVELLGGGEMFFKHDDEYLYVLMVAKWNGIASLCVERSEGVAVLHASAALGTADYKGRTDNAQRTRQFRFELRDTGSSLKERKARQRFLADELWFANTTKHGSTIRELQISLDIADEYGRIPMAATFYMFDEDLVAYWPEDLSDDCLNLSLIKGSAPDKLDFQPHRWPVVTIEKCASPGDR